MDEDSILNVDNLNDVSFLFNYAQRFRYGELHYKLDEETGLQAIIAIHSTKLGPSLGGCRCIEYPSIGAATVDALRLARGMTYKAAIAGLPLGGGKAVLIRPPVIRDREAYFKKYGEFVDSLGGRYVTAKDSGTSMEDMDIIATKTNYVTTTTPKDDEEGDPSYFTAKGVFRGIQAGVHHKFNKDSLKGIRVAIQGAGSVAHYLAELLCEEGAKITVCDIVKDNTDRFAKEFDADVVSPDKIYDVDCDVFSPSALGAIINGNTIPRLKAKVIAGCANNQLTRRHYGEELYQRGILYAPDYLVNAGGVIFASSSYNKTDYQAVEKKIDEIYDTLLRIFTRSDKEKEATNRITAKFVEEMIYEDT